MNQVFPFLILIVVPYSLIVFEIQHVLGGLLDFYLLFTLIALAVNLLVLFIYRKIKNKVAAFILFILGGFNAFVGFQLFVNDFDDLLLFGILLLGLGVYSILLPIKRLMLEKEELSSDDTND